MNSKIRLSANRSRSAKLAALVGVAVLGVSACTSDPSAQRVAKDLVDTLVDDEDERQCMMDKIDAYGKDELEKIAENADEAAATQNVGEISDLQQFENDLASCR